MTTGDPVFSESYRGGSYPSMSPTTGTNLGNIQIGTSTSQPFGTTTFGPMTGTEPAWSLPDMCVLGHIMNEDSIWEEAGTDTTPPRIVGTCNTCGTIMKFERIPGGMPYYKAGKLIGDAMALDDDDEWLPEVLGDLVILEKTIDREVEKLRRAKQLVSLSRSIATRKAITNAETDPTED